MSEARRYLIERVGEAAVVQLYADAFAGLALNDKILIWHLAQAAIAGRDIFYDQRYAHNLEMRDILEAILKHPSSVDPGTLAEVARYTKLFWINTGPYNNLTARKFTLRCTPAALAAAAHAAERTGARFLPSPGETLDQQLERLAPQFFDPATDPMVTMKTPGPGHDILTGSANNLYAGVAMTDLDGFEERHALNSRLVMQDGSLVEEVYRVGGRYGRAISAIIEHLEAAIPYATQAMAEALRALITFYQTGDDSDREAYDIAWIQDHDSPVDTINGFVEVYLDARGAKGAWEALVYYVNRDKTSAIRRLAANAQWFEDRMPWDPKYRKAEVQGVTANAIDVVIETGESGPITPVGINLPNDSLVRERYGSKSVSLSNVTEAYDKSTLPEMRTEFAWTPEEAARAATWGVVGSELFTNMHEVIGHGSGVLGEHLDGKPQAVLKELYSTLEEARADLVALYFLPDPKLAELGLIAAGDQAEMVLAEYEAQTRAVLVQLRRVREGTTLEEDHMRDRQLIIHWLMKNTSAIDVRLREGKTYYVVVDIEAFRAGVAVLLSDIQRIKSEGDYDSARQLVERYGVHFDPALRDEVVGRVDHLQLPSYTAFVMPTLAPVRNSEGDITDIAISYPLDLTEQMLEYAAATRALR